MRRRSTCNAKNEENHNDHYDYFLTDEALAYQQNTPEANIDKELYMEHDEKIMQMIIDFFDNAQRD